jgi:hypothetical protein
MINACILDSNTKICVNKIILNTLDEFIPTEGLELAPEQSGEIGWKWTTDGWEEPTLPKPSLQELELRVRNTRDTLLKSVVDRMNPIRWEFLSQEEKQIWVDYRQNLLDIPEQPGFPENVIWPTKPS